MAVQEGRGAPAYVDAARRALLIGDGVSRPMYTGTVNGEPVRVEWPPDVRAPRQAHELLTGVGLVRQAAYAVVAVATGHQVREIWALQPDHRGATTLAPPATGVPAATFAEAGRPAVYKYLRSTGYWIEQRTDVFEPTLASDDEAARIFLGDDEADLTEARSAAYAAVETGWEQILDLAQALADHDGQLAGTALAEALPPPARRQD